MSTRDPRTGRFLRADIDAERFIRLWNSGRSESEIADAFGGIRQQTVSKYAARFGLRLRRARWTDAEREHLAWCWTRGIALDDIAADVGRSPATVNEQRRMMGLPNRGRLKHRRLHPLPREYEYERLRRLAALAGAR